jgi:hypothetical protein
MRPSVHEAARLLEQRGLLERARSDHSARIIEHVGALLGRPLPQDLEDLYRERIRSVGDFLAVRPVWNDYVGWRTEDSDITRLLEAQAVPIFLDGCGSLYGLDITPGVAVPAVYFFDHDNLVPQPNWAAGSSLGAFLLLLGEHDRAYAEGRPAGWELQIDPDIDKCPRAPALWKA